MLCLCRPIYGHSLSFPLSGHYNQEKMLHCDYSSVVYLAIPSSSEYLWLFLTALTFVIPISVVTFCYVCIFKAARIQATTIRRQNQLADNVKKPPRAMQNYKAIKTIGFVLGVFIVSWMPSLVVSAADYFLSVNDQCIAHKLSYVVWPWIEAIAFTSSAINPWIYCLRNGEFREALHRSFHWFPLDSTPEFGMEPDQNQGL